MSDTLELLSQEQARQLRMMCHACLDQLSGGSSMFIDEDDHPCACRLARVGDHLVVVDFEGDPSRNRFRQIDLFLIKADTDRGFKLDLKHRLASFRAKHFATPEDWHLQIDQPPEDWFGPVTMLMLTALQPAMDRIAALQA